jgi:hypothetical protein
MARAAGIAPRLTRMRRPLIILLVVAFIVRVIGIGYGLPLWLVGDEPSFVFGALKMLELRTLVPALHHDAFVSTFYYTPYLSYLYLPPYAAIIGVRWLLFSGSFAEFKLFLQTDLSVFFLASRLISAAIGTATVAVVYAIGKRLFRDEVKALLSAALLALSFLHTNFSHWARHWVPATFVFSLAVYILCRDDWRLEKRYGIAALLVGAGMGVTQQVGLAAIFLAIWFFTVDRAPLLPALRSAWLWKTFAGFAAFAGLAYALWPPGFYVAAGAGQSIAASGKSIVGLLAGYPFYFLSLARSEPVMLIWLIVGGCILIFRRERFFAAFALFGIAYVAVFYFLFLYVDRFLLFLYPLIALVAGYGLGAAAEHWKSKTVVIVSIAAMSIAVIRYDMLLAKNDTRIRAIRYAETAFPAGARVMVFAPITRLPATAAAVDEQEAADPASLRSVDMAERDLPDRFFSSPRFHALNLNAIRTPDFLAHLGEYRVSRAYAYLMEHPAFAAERAGEAFAESGQTMAEFRGYENGLGDSIVNGVGGGWREIFFAPSIGPDIVIKRF